MDPTIIAAIIAAIAVIAAAVIPALIGRYRKTHGPSAPPITQKPPDYCMKTGGNMGASDKDAR